MKIDHHEDGITHINVYSKGKTQLGRDLSNFADIGFIHPIYGPFASMEGYWYWLKTGKAHSRLKSLVGFEAKRYGRTLLAIHSDDFNREIRQGIKCKLYQNPELLEALVHNDLPLYHYYVHSGKVVDPKGLDMCLIIQNVKRDFEDDYGPLSAFFLR